MGNKNCSYKGNAANRDCPGSRATGAARGTRGLQTDNVRRKNKWKENRRDRPQRRGQGHAQRRRELYAADQAQREALARRDVAQQSAYKGVLLAMAENTAMARSALEDAHRKIERLQREAQREAALRQELESSLRRRHPTPSINVILPQARAASPWLLISRPTGVTTPTIRA